GLVEQHARGVRGVLADGQAQRVALLLDLRERGDAGARVDAVDVAVPGRIARHDAHRQGLAEQALAAVRLRQAPRRVHERHLDLAADDGGGKDRRAGRHAQVGNVVLTRAAAHGDAEVAVAGVRLVRVPGDVQADLPDRLPTDKVRATRQRLHA